MTSLSLTDAQRRVLSYCPHLERILDTLNSRAALQVLDLAPEGLTIDVLQVECRVHGLDLIHALVWAREHSREPMLHVHSPTSLFRAGTLWFGKVSLEGLPDAYLRLELPLPSDGPSNDEPSGESPSVLVLTSHTDAAVLEGWAKNERERLAEESVTRYLAPVLRQAERFGSEAITLGVRAAFLKLPPERATDLFARAVPVLMTAWVHAWCQAVATRAPGLRRVEAELAFEHTEASVRAQIYQMDSVHGRPTVQRMQLFGSSNEPIWVWHEPREVSLEEEQEELERLRMLTGAAFASREEAVTFFEELESLVLIHFQAYGTTRIDWPH